MAENNVSVFHALCSEACPRDAPVHLKSGPRAPLMLIGAGLVSHRHTHTCAMQGPNAQFEKGHFIFSSFGAYVSAGILFRPKTDQAMIRN